MNTQNVIHEVTYFFKGMDTLSIFIIACFLVLFVLVAIKLKRPIVFNGEQERLNKKSFFIWTLSAGKGTSFASKNRNILNYNEVTSRRKKFGEAIVSPILVIIALLAGIFFLSCF